MTVTDAAGAAKLARRRGRARGGLLVVRVLASVHVAAVFAQPVFAGGYLSGRYDLLAWHATGADVVSYLGYAQLLAVLALWILGGPRWPVPATVLLVVAETAQYVAGQAGALDLHVPLGVAIVTAAALLLVALWRPQRRGVAEASR